MAGNIISVWKGIMKGFLHNVAHIFAGVVTDDPHLNDPGKIECKINWNLWAYSISYPPLDRV